MIDLNDVLLAMSNIPVDDPIAEIWGRGLQGGYKTIKYTGTLPITINANGDALIDYRIYGADGGVGEPTENLINPKITGEWQTIPITPSMPYVISRYVDGWAISLRFETYDENDEKIWDDYLGTWYSENFTTASNAVKLKVFIPEHFYNAVSIIQTNHIPDTVQKPYPANYIPYGYKLPMTVSDGNTEQTVPVYIGENQLGEDEYVSFSDQKIYKDVGGTLTPTAPPVPLPEIPTVDGTTVIDYDGTPKPSQMYVKYKVEE